MLLIMFFGITSKSLAKYVIESSILAAKISINNNEKMQNEIMN